MGTPVGIMAKVLWCLVLVFLVFQSTTGRPGRRMKRGFGSGYGDSNSGYGRGGSDERDASVSEENGNGCNSSGYGRGYNSGSRELAYNRDGGRTSFDTRGGRSFARSSASAVASAAAYTMNHKPDVN